MTREQVFSEFTIVDGLIINPGKFEGEPPFVPALWELCLDGLVDEENESTFSFTIENGDPLRIVWPELDTFLGKCEKIYLSQSDQGFVYCYL